MGSTNSPFYNGQYLADPEDNVVMIAVNLRINVFGYDSAQAIFKI